MKCPVCKNKTKVLDTRNGINRRRLCPTCDVVFFTTERIDRDSRIANGIAQGNYYIDGNKVKLKKL